MRGKRFAGFAFSLASAIALSATVAGAAGPAGAGGVGGAGVGGASGLSGLSGLSSLSGLSGMSWTGAVNVPAITLPNGSKGGSAGRQNGTLTFFPFPTNDPNHYHEIKLIGRLAKDESGLAIDQQIVRMRVDGHSIPMSINGDVISNTLQFDQGDELGQTLYRLILSKPLEVVGDAKLRSQIADDAAANPPKQILVDGFVYDRMTPYLVLVSVHDAP